MVEPVFDILNPVTVLERLRIVTTLGIRFWDPTLDVQIGDGLIVTARPSSSQKNGSRDPARRAFLTRSGIYAFHGLPGLRNVEYPADDSLFGSSPAATTQFTVDVSDEQRRFLPMVFRVDVPYHGIFPTETVGSPGAAAPPGVYLFSAPSRTVPSTQGAIRAQLDERVDATTRRPAAYAVVEVQLVGQPTWYGLADERGALLATFPYPTFLLAPGGSPATATQQRWDVTIRARYAPSSLVIPPGSTLPEIRSIFGQAYGHLWPRKPNDPAQAVSEIHDVLFFGQDLVLRTDSGPTLVIGPATSP